MYNVLVVEDEISERENIRSSSIWSTGEFALVACVADGEDGLRVLNREKIDIVVTDINMPVMDGLELSSRIRLSMPDIKIIILSGFGDFQYARQALSLGVSEYLLKPVTSKDLLEALNKVACKLKDEMLVHQEIMNYRQNVQKERLYQRNVFLENLSFGIWPTENVGNQTEALGLNLDFQTVCCLIVSFYENKILINESEHLVILEIQEIIENALKDQEIISFNSHQREYFIIFRNPQLLLIKSLLKQIQRNISKQRNLSQTSYPSKIALGGVKQSLAGVAESFADARFLLNFQHQIANEELLCMDELMPFLQSTYQYELIMSNEMELIAKTLNFGSQQDIPVIVDSFAGLLQLNNYNLNFFQNICIQITIIINKFLIMIDENSEDILFDQNGWSNNPLPTYWQKWAGDIPEFKQYLTSTLTAVIEIRDKKNRYKYNDVILKAKKYIDQHYQDANISLTGIASFVNINPSYFSSLFSQEMGESFIEYLTGIRIEKAKFLLKTTSMRILDIAFAVGYTDSNYFSKIFKRITNESARNFKNQS